ncbi:MAG: pyruvate dehydrogenase complex dihydrolipoamide acetyltransferase [Bacteroidetes bacterium]|jgi:pyruvate dehydrogenase E2 component (dihydrolipoamide acetyltransferase)|nr:pyruvate dehydrogenase complex dihydrolipoamide acetyltransferase [Bacteroidota bacterium]
MAVKIEMPKLSDTMEEGVIAKWNVEEGDKVSSGDVIAEVETDKATMEVEVFDDGTILKILAQEGDAIPLGGLMAVVGEEGEDISEIIEEAESGQEPEKTEVEEEKEEKSKEKKESAKEEKSSESSTSDNGRIKASPLARKMAEDKGIDLNHVEGSGPEGRIIKRDIEDYEPAAAPAAQIQYTSEEDEDVKISQMRKTIARRLAESKFTNPHFYETIDIDMEHAIEARNRLNEISEVKISFNDIVVKACAAALRQHPYVNSSWMDDVIRQHGDVNIAVAVAIEEGLMTPVINHADKKNLRQISTETRELAGLAKDRKLQPEQMEGSTFTVSNLGMFGIEEFTAIINPPNVCILAVGAIRDVPVVKDGEVVPGKRMKVTLSSDHRVVDGAKAADFLNTLRELLENPLSMLL